MSVQELANPYDEATFRQWVLEQAGERRWFEYVPGGLFFVYDSPNPCSFVGEVDKDILHEVLGREQYLLIRAGVEPVEVQL